jgi:hypothetical protein
MLSATGFSFSVNSATSVERSEVRGSFLVMGASSYVIDFQEAFLENMKIEVLGTWISVVRVVQSSHPDGRRAQPAQLKTDV